MNAFNLSSISRYRHALMGMAMLMVQIYHGPSFPHGNRFVIGYIGVDVFLFLSGLGLCYSYCRSTIGQFYLKRLLRIMPVFVTMFVCVDLIDGVFSIPLLLSQVSTFNFYTSSPNPYDWYLTALLMLYLLFPLFYVIISKSGRWSRLSYLLALVMILAYGQIGGGNWQHQCLLGRIPIFLMGIATYFGCGFNVRECVLWAVLSVPVWFCFHIYLGVAMLAPMLMYILVAIFQIVPRRALSAIEIVGKYSLEVYSGNVVAAVLLCYCHCPISNSLPMAFCWYLCINVLCVIPLIGINRLAQQYFGKWSNRYLS